MSLSLSLFLFLALSHIYIPYNYKVNMSSKDVRMEGRGKKTKSYDNEFPDQTIPLSRASITFSREGRMKGRKEGGKEGGKEGTPSAVLYKGNILNPNF